MYRRVRHLLPTNKILLRASPFSTTTTFTTRRSTGSETRLGVLKIHSIHPKEKRLHRITHEYRCSYHVLRGAKSTQNDTRRRIKVSEFPVSTLHESSGDKKERHGVVYTTRNASAEGESENIWIVKDNNDTSNDIRNRLQSLPQRAISLLLPAQYPQSVSPGYLGFVSLCFTASIAGSAAMVLSTQTLLLAVGIVGQNSTSSSVMAGALNWVMKDFIGQLGGIVFASQMGKTKAFDSDPKRWRMVSALAMDGATMMEILAPLCHQSMILPVASVANIGKNIGFLTASASRAALHQSLAITGNLGDVTVKAGSQSMMASLLGTSLGIGLSSLLQHDAFNFGVCFVCLSVIHEGCTYLSLQNVPLAHFNRQRLYLVLEEYLETGKIPSTADVAKKEGFFPLMASDWTLGWLNIGRPLAAVYKNPCELQKVLKLGPPKGYLIRVDEETRRVDLVYLKDANEQDLVHGMYHACLIHRHAHSNDEKTGDRSREDQILQETRHRVQEGFLKLFQEMEKQGWNTSSGLTIVEDSNANRITIDV